MPRPAIAADEVLVRVLASGLDRWCPARHDGSAVPDPAGRLRPAGPKNLVLGSDVAGVVEQVGADVTRFRGRLRGSASPAAPRRVRRRQEAKLVPSGPDCYLPAGCGAARLGADRAAGGARQGACRARPARPGDRRLRRVGNYVVQLAKAFGGEVTGVCSASKTDPRALARRRPRPRLPRGRLRGRPASTTSCWTSGHSSLATLRRALTASEDAGHRRR